MDRQRKVSDQQLSEVLFLDIEYFQNYPVELSIVQLIGDTVKKLYSERFNPFGEENFKYNPIVSQKIGIPNKDLKNKKPFSNHAEEIRKILEGKTAIHFKGSDGTILMQAFRRLDIGLDSKFECFGSNLSGDLIQNFIISFPEVENQILNLERGHHCSFFDSILLACLYAKKLDSNFEISSPITNTITEAIRIKSAENEACRNSKRKREADKLGPLASFKLTVYFTGFGHDKDELKERYSKLGCEISSGYKVKKNTHVIIPNKHDESEEFKKFKSDPQKKSEIVTLDQFEIIINELLQKNEKQAS